MAQAPVSNSPPQLAALCFSDTIRKVDRAVARLEELQCMVRTSYRNATFAKCSPPNVRAKLALHAGERFLNKSSGNGDQKYAQHASHGKPALSTMCDDAQQKQCIHSNKSSGLPAAMLRRRARVADFPLPLQKQVNSSASRARKDFELPSTVNSPPSMPLSSPPSACSSSVQVVTRKARPNKHIASSQRPRTCSANAEPAASLKPSRTFIVHAGQANPNRPWCLSSQSTATNSSITSNYIYTPSSSSSAPLPRKSPSRFSPLHRQISSKCRENLQMQPLLCKSPECVMSKPIKTSPNCPQKVPWFSQSRLSPAPPSPSTKRYTRRFSLMSSRYKESPPRPLPALITRLPTRRQKALSPVKKPAVSSNRKTQACRGSRSDGSPQEVPTMFGRALESPSKRSALSPIPPLPLPPALQVLPCSTQHNPTSPLSCKMKASHKRSSSCPRQCLLPVADNATDVNHCNVSSSPLSAIDTKGACFQSTGKENCFSGCGPAAWPCLWRSWSFRERHSLGTSNSTGAGPYLLRHVNGYMQKEKNTRAQPHMYKADSFTPEPNRDQPKLYIG